MHAPQPIVPLMSSPSIDFMPIQRLRSPIHFAESCITPPPATCSRRRSKGNNQSSRRRRQAARVNYHISTPTHAFDELPWISTLEAAPALTNPWDIADLSLLPESESGLGPVRRRKTSLRSNPMNTSPSPSGSPLPIRDTSLLPPAPVPTPRSHFIPSRVLFHNLMPISCDYRSGHSHPCINSSPMTF